MNNFLDLAKSRYSCRSFCEKEVEKEKIDLILNAGQIAPTACNKQPIKIYVIKSKEALDRLQKCKTQHNNETLAFLVTYNKEECWKREYDDKLSGEVDASIVATHMMLEAYDLGVGSVWIMHFIPEAIKEEFKLDEKEEPVALLIMGYPSIDSSINPRHYEYKKLEEMVKYL